MFYYSLILICQIPKHVNNKCRSSNQPEVLSIEFPASCSVEQSATAAATNARGKKIDANKNQAKGKGKQQVVAQHDSPAMGTKQTEALPVTNMKFLALGWCILTSM